jgi:hypothetical protein
MHCDIRCVTATSPNRNLTLRRRANLRLPRRDRRSPSRRAILTGARFFRFPPDARWNPERSVVEFGIGIGEYEGVVRVSRRVFQILLLDAATPERCLEPSTCTGPGSNSSPSGRFAAGS